MPSFYSSLVQLAHLVARAILPSGSKAGRTLAGQAGWLGGAEAFAAKGLGKPFWMHCASLGEFEQGRPVLEALKAAYPVVPIVVTFFSVSGYEARKSYALADLVSYLPPDTDNDARYWLDLIQPQAAFWVKYDFWAEHLQALAQRQIPVYLIAALPTKRQFSGVRAWYYGRMYERFSRIFLQYAEHLHLLPPGLAGRALWAGDPRHDNVARIARGRAEIDFLIPLLQPGPPVLMLGSAWEPDVEAVLGRLDRACRAIVFPHEMDPGLISLASRLGPQPALVVSQGGQAPAGAGTLVVDKVGYLALAYKYADVAYVGGAFASGLHNILEAAAWGKPVVIGPKTARFPEAAALVAAGGALQGKTAEEVRSAVQLLLDNPTLRHNMGQAARAFIAKGQGASARILDAVRLDLDSNP